MIRKHTIQEIANYFNVFITSGYDKTFLLYPKNPFNNKGLTEFRMDSLFFKEDINDYDNNILLAEPCLHEHDLVLCWNVQDDLPNIRKYLRKVIQGSKEVFEVYNSSISYKEYYTCCIRYEEKIVTNLETK